MQIIRFTLHNIPIFGKIQSHWYPLRFSVVRIHCGEHHCCDVIVYR